MIDHKTQLVPPAVKGTSCAEVCVEAVIEKVCPGVVVICGVLRKKITYTAVDGGIEMPCHTIKDDVPFQCLISRDDIKECDKFEIKEITVCEVFAHEANFGGPIHPECGERILAFRFVEKEIIKIAIKKKKKHGTIECTERPLD
ncbi:hypothetical protein RB620_26065 [Paenibacillus sp. LHD-117]|uniref:hypothetical protein n=1 Tax=Paenibacillus sp. LHD-117 TaxID=3071412 RepID=UPI0027E11E3B|nr:hypothetical protein [Paenibacillus sp. LHD-117]MDQ6422898.1 hypothetical protein [Paenibacillus sp. LHD-117]